MSRSRPLATNYPTDMIGFDDLVAVFCIVFGCGILLISYLGG
jgi:hypothetical protein